MNYKKIAALGVAAIVVSGCASGLNNMESKRYAQYKARGVLVEEKNPNTGALLGLLPGGGSFYAREPALGVLNLLAWPLSIIWDPISGFQGSRSINYTATEVSLNRSKQKALNDLSDEMAAGNIDSQEYLLRKRKIDEQYDAE